MNDQWDRALWGMYAMIAGLTLLALVVWVMPVHAHDSWISKKGFRSPSGMSNPGIHCCGDNDCGFWDGREGEEITLQPDGYHVDATFTLYNRTFHITQIIPENQTFPFSEDGMYWACVNWGAYTNHNLYVENGWAGADNPVRCFFAPPPGS